jgi:hypothetical protein
VPITFNGATPFRNEIDEIRNSSLGLATRALYRYHKPYCFFPFAFTFRFHVSLSRFAFTFRFHVSLSRFTFASVTSLLTLLNFFSYFIGGAMLFSDFVVQMQMHPLFAKLDLEMAIRCIMEHSNKGVLLLVDEIMKSGGDMDDNNLIKGKVTEIGKCLDTLTTRFNVVLTTLNTLATKKETSSGRFIDWITLAPPTLPEAVSLFGEDAVQSPVLRQCIADCNGHHRSLETLKVVWDEYKEKQYSYPMLIQELGRRMDSKYRQLSIPLIRAALRGYKVGLGDSPDGQQTYAKYLEQGFYLNTLDESSRFVPRVSPLQLLLFALNMAGTDPLSVVCVLFSLFVLFIYLLFTYLRIG